MKHFLFTLCACIGIAASSPAFAKGMHIHAPAVNINAIAGDASSDFGDSPVVADKELGKMRGGFSAGGVDIQFSYNSIATINGNVTNNISINSNTGGNLSAIGQPILIQNVSNNTVIALQQQLNLTVANAGIAQGTASAMRQAALLNAMAFK